MSQVFVSLQILRLQKALGVTVQGGNCIVFDSGIQNYSRISHWVRRAVGYLDGYNFQKTYGKQRIEKVWWLNRKPLIQAL